MKISCFRQAATLAFILALSALPAPNRAHAGAHNNTDGYNGAVGCIELDETQTAGGQPENKRLLNLGQAVTIDRTFEVNYDFYSIPDRMKIVFNGANNTKKTITTGLVSGAAKLTFTIPAGSTPYVEITMNEGSGLSGTAWVYTPKETTAQVGELVNLAPGTCIEGWRNTLGGNIHGEKAGIVLDKPDKSATGANKVYHKTYYFTVPANTQCLRVSAVGVNPDDSNVQNGADPASLIVSRHCPPTGFTSTTETPALLNAKWRNTIIIPNPTDPGKSELYYAVLFKKPDAANPVSGGVLRVDCLQGGIWKQADVAYDSFFTHERERIAAGIESDTLTPVKLPTSGRVLLLSHGRTDSPLGNMQALGAAVGKQWGATPYHINWSEGSYWNGNSILVNSSEAGPLVGSRFIGPSVGVLAPSLKGLTVDFFGHSWGTYIGNELALTNGLFQRFFALDPANNRTGAGFFTGLSYSRPINFAQRAAYSMAIFGNGSFGSLDLTTTAHDSLILIPANDDSQGNALSPNPVNLKRHSEPVFVMKNFIQATGIGSTEASFALVANNAQTSLRPWKNNLRLFNGCQVQLNTDGAGNLVKVTKLRYYDAVTGALVVK